MKGMWTWLYDEKRVISASRPPRRRVIQPWMSNNQTLPTPNARRSSNGTRVPAARQARRSPPQIRKQLQPRSGPGPCTANNPQPHQAPHDLQP